MPEADTYEAPQGATFHGRLLEAVSEAFVGNGISNDGDAKVTATATDLEISVSAATDLRYAGSTYSPTASTFTLSAGPTTTTNGQDDRRVDLVYFDSSGGSYAVAEGTAAPNPNPPPTPTDSILLALVLVGHGVTNVTDDEILNWRSHPAAELPVDTADIADDAVTSPKIATDAVTATQIASGAVDTSELASGAVTSTEIQDGAVATADLAADAVTAAKIASGAVTSTQIQDGTIVDADISSSTTIARGKLDDERITTGGVTTNTTTSGEEVVLVDTSGGAVTITLASSDANEGNFVTVVDVGGSADSANITIETESSETIDGGSSTTIESKNGARVFVSDGTNWFTAGGGSAGGGSVEVQEDGKTVVSEVSTLNFGESVDVTSSSSGKVTVDVNTTSAPVPPEETFEGDFDGSVADAGEQTVTIHRLSDDEKVRVDRATLTTELAQAVASGVDLALVTFDNAGSYTVQSTLLSGDGSTVHDYADGGTDDPVGEYGNTTGSAQTIGVLVTNSSGASSNVFASVIGRTGLNAVNEAFAQLLSRRVATYRPEEVSSLTGASARKAQVLTRRGID